MNVVIKPINLSFDFDSSMRIKIVCRDVHIEKLGGYTIILPFPDPDLADKFYRTLMKAYGEYSAELVVDMDTFILPFS